MSLLALFTLIMTAGGGIYLLSIWLIEYDKDFHAVAATRLPPPVLAGHVLLAGGGLLVWGYYVLADADDAAWLSLLMLCAAASLGLVMAIRWIGVYRASRASRASQATPRLVAVGAHDSAPAPYRVQPEGPPERNFPLPVVIAHGAFAVITLTLVLLAALGVGGS